jgi:hypothetical protein
VQFALTEPAAPSPSAKLAAARWASEDVLITGLSATSDDACYRAMDWLLALEKAAITRAAELLGLEIELPCFDTTSTCFVTAEADAPVASDAKGLPVPDGTGDAAGVGRGTPPTPR